MVLLADTTAIGAQNVIERIKNKLNNWNSAGHLEGFQISLSIGLSEWHDGDTVDEMLDGADRRMYEHKSSQSATS